MKSIILFAFLIVLGGAASAQPPTSPSSVPIQPGLMSAPTFGEAERDAWSRMQHPPTADDLMRMEKETKQVLSVMPPSPVPAELQREVKAGPPDYFQNKLILKHEGFYTVIPNGSVLHVPDNLKSYLRSSPDGGPARLLMFVEFAKQFPFLVKGHDVVIDDLGYVVPLPPSVLESLRTTQTIVVAQYENNAISTVRP